MTDLILLQTVLETSIELWKPIQGYPGYEVSSMGQVRSFWTRRNGGKPGSNGCWRVIGEQPKFLKFQRHKQGYEVAYMYGPDRRLIRFVHRLVAMAFLPNPTALPEVNHRNGVKDDNRIVNLEWISRLDNQRHAWKTGLITSEILQSAQVRVLGGKKRKNQTLSVEQIVMLRERYSRGDISQAALCRETGIEHSAMSRLLRRERWKFVE